MLQRLQAVRQSLIEKKKASYIALTLTYRRLEHLLLAIEEQGFPLLSQWQETLSQMESDALSLNPGKRVSTLPR